jgi:hypothetical protein
MLNEQAKQESVHIVMIPFIENTSNLNWQKIDQ